MNNHSSTLRRPKAIYSDLKLNDNKMAALALKAPQ